MKVDIFDFELDRDLIAVCPAEPRDSSRLLDLSVEDKITDRRFYDLPELLNKNDVLVFNDTKVIPAKLYGRRGQAELEITLYRPIDALNWWAFIKNSKRLKEGDTITFYNDQNSDFSATVVEKKGEDGTLLRFDCSAEELNNKLEEYGSMPLPPYITAQRNKLQNEPAAENVFRDANGGSSRSAEAECTQKVHEHSSTGQEQQMPYKNVFRDDKENYQTIYAKHEGAVAAPTAGLHFTDKVMKALDEKGIKKVFLTLHVGAGTFLPVKVDDTSDHKMHSEYGIISQEAADTINEAKSKGGRIIAVGTTSLRLLESAADNSGIVHPFANDTNIFITPGYKFKIIDMIITNFHLPKSTLFMLVSAIAGLDRMQNAYKHAMENKYRFYSYGDSSIIKCVNKI